MALIQVMYNRELPPDVGQQYLDEMMERVPATSLSGHHAGKLHIPGVTRRENPFPEWIRDPLVKNGLAYNDINLTYQRPFPTLEEASVFVEWFDSTFRPWCCARHPLYTEFVNNWLHIRAMDEHDEVFDKESY